MAFQEGQAWFRDGSQTVGPFYATFDQLETGDPPYLQVAKGGAGSGYPPPQDFTDGTVVGIHFQPQNGEARNWSSWAYQSGMMFDRFGNPS